MARVASLLRNLFRRGRVERDLDDEVAAYFEILVERAVARGLSPDEAKRAVRLRLERPENVKENVRESRAGAPIDATIRDVQYAARVLRKSPGFTIVAVLTLALGIGANTAIFSFINAVMLRLLPVEHPEQLALLTDPTDFGIAMDTTENGTRARLSYPEFTELRAHNTAFSGLFAAQNQVSDQDLYREGERAAQPSRVRAELVSGEFFDVLGVRAIVGRVFTAAEDRAPGASPVAVISYDFWQREFDGADTVLDTKVRVGQGVFQILGVTPPGFHGILVGTNADIWFPMTMQAQVLPGHDFLKPRDTLWLQVMGRIAPRMSSKQAESSINVTLQQILRGWAAALPTEKERRNMLNQRLVLRPGGRGASELRGEFADPLMLLMAMVAIVLLIACANIANLMLARANRRQREIGVRLALGAARGRLIRQLLTESLMVACAGGILGILLAVIGSRLLLAAVAGGVNDLGLEVTLDTRVLLFTSAISFITGLLFGLAPAIRSTRPDVGRTLAANGRSLSGSRGRARTGRILVIAQVALSLVLVMGAALFVRSLHNLITADLGYARDRLLMARVDPAPAGYKGAAEIALYERLRQALSTIPGVRDATLSNTGLFNGDSGDHLSIEGSSIHDPEQLVSRWTEVGADYFTTLGIPVLRGREITSADAGGRPVCLVNEAFVRRFFPNSDPIGRHITDEYPTTRETFEIVGVVANSREHSTSEPPRPRFYANIAHPIGTVGPVSYLMRTSSADPAGVGSAIRESIRQVDANLPLVSLRTMNDQIERRLLTERLVAQLAAFFGAVALLMAAIGLYGVMANSMQQRTSEIGIRMALGASMQTVVGMVLMEALTMVAIGAFIGLPAAIIAGRLIASELYGLTVRDPSTMALATAVIVASGLLAAYLPARRAARVDPMVALKYE